MEWISVDDRLPENLDDVLVCHWYYDDVMDCAIAYYNGNSWRTCDGLLEAENYDGGATIKLSDNPTHWMPLPSAPK